jgi:glycosyltransferase involved in cell wall biosynthesis
VSRARLRVGLDLDGSLESLGDSMTDLADALEVLGGCELVRFRSQHPTQSPRERQLRLRSLWLPMWRRSLGPSLDGLLGGVDIVHVAGVATPPTKTVPLVISVDDLRPLREETSTHQRIAQLRRAVKHGALIVASSRTASHEVQSVLGVARSRVVVVSPAVPYVEPTTEGTDLVVNVTGLADLFLSVAPVLVDFATRHSSRVVALTSDDLGSKVRSSGLNVTVRPRREARAALANARVVMHLSDGARFPSFAIAALSAGVPTIARSTDINRELLGGAAALMSSYDEVPETLEDLWSNESRRAIMMGAGRSRAADFAPATAARAYMALYTDVVRGFGS